MSVVRTEVKYVYRFDEGSAAMVSLLGGKGANLAEMKRLGFPVPNGFIISTGYPTTVALLSYTRARLLRR